MVDEQLTEFWVARRTVDDLDKHNNYRRMQLVAGPYDDFDKAETEQKRLTKENYDFTRNESIDISIRRSVALKHINYWIMNNLTIKEGRRRGIEFYR